LSCLPTGNNISQTFRVDGENANAGTFKASKSFLACCAFERRNNADRCALKEFNREIAAPARQTGRSPAMSVEWVGQVFARRQLSRALLFLDLRRVDDVTCTQEVASVAVDRALLTGDDDDADARMRAVRLAVKLGDVVRVVGAVEESAPDGRPGAAAAAITRIQARTVEVVAPWRTRFPHNPTLRSGVPAFSPWTQYAIDGTIVAVHPPPEPAIAIPQPASPAPAECTTTAAGSPEHDIVAASGAGIPPCTVGGGHDDPITAHASALPRWYRGVPLHGLCSHALNTSGCRRAACSFLHPGAPVSTRDHHSAIGTDVDAATGADDAWTHVPTAAAPEFRLLRNAYLAWRMDVRAAGLQRVAGDTSDPHSGASHPERAGVFVDWLLRHAPADLWKPGAVVLDIAGGKGDVSRRLAAATGARCVVVDPEKRRSVTARKAEEMSAAGVSFLHAWLDDAFQASHADLLRSAVLLIGMHPDQATEPIVQVAAALGKPFAVVPCCVFSDHHPDRRLPDGTRVTTLSHFVAYLRHIGMRPADAGVAASASASGAVVHTVAGVDFLPYRGANAVVFRWAWDD